MPSESVSDQELISRLASGDKSALASLYDRHIRLLWSLVIRIVRSQAESEDIIQDLFVKVWQRASNYDPARGEVSAWLCQMARSSALDWIRSSGSRTARESAYGAEQERLAEPVYESQRRDQNWEKVVLAVKELSSDHRELIESAYFEGLSQTQLAKKFNLPLGTVKSKVRQGMLQLKVKLLSERE